MLAMTRAGQGMTWGCLQIYPLLVVGTLAGTILPGQPEAASWRIFLGGVLFQGLAWVVSFLMYGIYMQRLMTSSLPSPSVRPGMFVSVGPAGKQDRRTVRLWIGDG